jgi:hypothetical protein
VTDARAQELLSEAIWLNLNDDADRPFDSNLRRELNEDASVESNNRNKE